MKLDGVSWLHMKLDAGSFEMSYQFKKCQLAENTLMILNQSDPILLTSWIASFKKCLLADTRRFWPKLYYFFCRLIQKFHFLELTLVFHQNPMFLVLSI